MVVDFPELVGPVIKIMPKGFLALRSTTSKLRPVIPNSGKVLNPIVGSKILKAAFSPRAVGKIATLKSICLSPTLAVKRPSWGRRVSSICKSERILMRETMAGAISTGKTTTV